MKLLTRLAIVLFILALGAQFVPGLKSWGGEKSPLKRHTWLSQMETSEILQSLVGHMQNTQMLRHPWYAAMGVSFELSGCSAIRTIRIAATRGCITTNMIDLSRTRFDLRDLVTESDRMHIRPGPAWGMGRATLIGWPLRPQALERARVAGERLRRVAAEEEQRVAGADGGAALTDAQKAAVGRAVAERVRAGDIGSGWERNSEESGACTGVPRVSPILEFAIIAPRYRVDRITTLLHEYAQRECRPETAGN
jgi:hypothetical protein